MHKCKGGPQLLLLKGTESSSESDELEGMGEPPEISLHALSGWSAHNTMKVIIKIGVHELVALIDSGSTHNFISERMANLMQLPICPTEPFHVKVANGKSLQCQGKFDNV